MHKKILFILLLLMPFLAFAQEEQVPQDVFFRAEVVEILKQEQTELPDGTQTEQQKILLRGLEGEYENKEVEFDGFGQYDVLNKKIYQEGEQVLAVASFNAEGNPTYYITDYVRTRSLWWLAFVFVLSILIIGRWKGLRSVIALIFTFLIIIKYIIPQILAGANPVFVVFVGSIAILLIIIYITEGFGARSHIAVLSIFISLIITILISWFFVSLAKLSGAASEDMLFLLHIGEQVINFKGLLLAGIIIGALGVLDDVVISQVATTEQIAKANKSFNTHEIFTRAYKVGVSHIASMTNTLFLAYAGVSLPLLILFVSGESAFLSWSQTLNSEIIATEIVRALTGSIGLILSVPIATFIAAWWYRKR